MKRTIEETQNIVSMAECLMLFSESGADNNKQQRNRSTNQAFTCKTCNRQFSSFQALGGHRASHKKPKLREGDIGYDTQRAELTLKPKTHECSICGLEFAIGHALGGHMRRHRGAMTKSVSPSWSLPPLSSLTQLPVIKRSNSRRVLCLDLNLGPPDNDFGFSLQECYEEKSSPVFHCFI